MDANRYERELEPRQLQALAHPLRVRLLAVLREHGPATATQLAQRLGLNSGATSYHLRQLAAHGFVEDVTGRGAGRERWWRPSFGAHRFNPAYFLDDPQLRAALDVYLREMLDAQHQRTADWLAGQASWDPAWLAAAAVSERVLRLTPERLHSLVKQLDEVIAGYRDEDPDGQQVVVAFQAFPRRAPDVAGRETGDAS